MARRLAVVALLALIASHLGISAHGPSRACAPVMGEGAHVAIATESALIVWDEKARKQHFIRRASFEAKVPYFGFLVPTPTPPELAEAPDRLFTLLEDRTKPEIRTEKKYEPISLLPRLSPSAKLSDSLGGNVTVLDRQRVAGYDAVVLRASDAEELRKWLERHGYDARPALSAWLAPYVKAGWIITAFQIAKGNLESDYFSTQAVRMTFASERPFFPYSEPLDERDKLLARPVRLLRVFFVANQRVQGAFDDPNKKWSGEAVWAGSLEGNRQELQEHLDAKAVALPEAAWLTVFDDHASSRLGNPDLFFSPSPDRSELRRPPITRYDVFYYPGPDLIVGAVIVAVVAFLVWRAVRRRRLRPI